jgi:hypothetical protein
LLALKLLVLGGDYCGLIVGYLVRFLDRDVHMGDRNGWVKTTNEIDMI